MQQLRIVVKPFKLEEALRAIRSLDGVVVTHIEEVKGYTEVRRERLSFYRESEYRIDYLPKKYVSIICRDNRKEDLVELLCKTASTAEVGDGKIFVMPVMKLIDVESYAEDDNAL